jgi:hypothetical protein
MNILPYACQEVFCVLVRKVVLAWNGSSMLSGYSPPFAVQTPMNRKLSGVYYVIKDA